MKITIEGKDYDINLEKSLAAGLLKPIIPRHSGQVYKRNEYGTDVYYLLATVGTARDSLDMLYYTVALVCLFHGATYYKVPCLVQSRDDITDKEWENIANNGFQLVDGEFSKVFVVKK